MSTVIRCIKTQPSYRVFLSRWYTITFKRNHFTYPCCFKGYSRREFETRIQTYERQCSTIKLTAVNKYIEKDSHLLCAVLRRFDCTVIVHGTHPSSVSTYSTTIYFMDAQEGLEPTTSGLWGQQATICSTAQYNKTTYVNILTLLYQLSYFPIGGEDRTRTCDTRLLQRY